MSRHQSTQAISFSAVNPYTMVPAAPLHDDIPPLRNGVIVSAGSNASRRYSFTSPAFVEHLIIIQLKHHMRLTVKMQRQHSVTLAPARVTIIPRGTEVHWKDADGASQAVIMAVPQAVLETTAANDAGIDPARIEVVERAAHLDHSLHLIGQAALGELQSGGMLGALYWESLIATTSIHLLRHHTVFDVRETKSAGPIPPKALQNVLDYIHDHLDDELTLDEMAALCHLSPFHFARKFKDAMGMPPYQYVLNCRVQRAKELLTAGRHTISEVAQIAGFANQSHLSRHVKRQLGVAPGALLPLRKNGQKEGKKREE